MTDYGFFEHDYPYTNFHEMNLNWILRQMIELRSDMRNFVKFNTIKYANPIQWDISRQYEGNTVVIDPTDGNAYLSVQPVPFGVSISDTDYWTNIGNFSEFYESVKNSITASDEGSRTVASQNRSVGDLVWLADVLYVITSNISAGDPYEDGVNCEETTIEECLKGLDGKIGALSNLKTTNKTNLVLAINEVFDKTYKPYDTMLNVIADTALTTGDYVKTLGYYEKNDGGAGEYFIIDELQDAFNISLDNGLYAVLIDDYSDVNVLKCGLMGGTVTEEQATMNSDIIGAVITAVYAVHPTVALSTGFYRGGGSIYIPAGNYVFNKQIPNLSGRLNLRIHGDNEGNTRLNIKSTTNNFTLISNTSDFNHYMGMEIDHLTLTNFACAIEIINAVNCKIHDNMFEGCTIGIKVDTFVGNYIFNNIMTGGVYGISLSMSNSNSTSMYIHHNWIAHTEAAAIWLRETGAYGVRTTYFDDNIFEYCPYGIYAAVSQANYSRIYVNRCHIEQCTTNAIYSVRVAIRLRQNDIDTHIYISNPVNRLYDLDNFNMGLTINGGYNQSGLLLKWYKDDKNIIDTVEGIYQLPSNQIMLSNYPHISGAVNGYELRYTSSNGMYYCIGRWTPGSSAFTPIESSVKGYNTLAPTCNVSGTVQFSDNGNNKKIQIRTISI